MAVSINEAHQFIRGLLKKNKSGFVSPEDIDRYLNRAVNDWISSAITKYKKTKKFDYDHLLTKKATFTVTSSTGTQDLPADYVEALTIYVQSNGVDVEGKIYNWDEFLEIKNSSILAPDIDNPIATIFIDSAGDDKIQFAPVPVSGSYTYTLLYVRKPTDCNFAYTVSNGNITYNSTGSVDISISDRFIGDIYARTLLYLGITLENPVLIQAEQIKDANQRNDEQ